MSTIHATKYTPAVRESVQYALDQYANGYCTVTELVVVCFSHDVHVTTLNGKEMETSIDTGRVLCDLTGFPELERVSFHATVELA